MRCAAWPAAAQWVSSTSGYDPFIDRKVAIKVRSRLNSEEEDRVGRKLFLNEAKAAGALDHPGILRVYDAGEVDGHSYIVMEYVEGGLTLQKYTQKKTLMPPADAVEYIRQCALALDFAHKRGVMHRDIKPANIMLTEDSQAKLCDFGIAQRMNVDLTQPLNSYGSPLYMSPEQIDGKELNIQADLYSLGVTMFELLTARPPFTADAISMLAVKILTETPADVTKLRPELSPELGRIVSKALARDLKERYQSGGELADALAAFADREDTVPEQLSESARLKALREAHFFEGFSAEEIEEVAEVGEWEHVAYGGRLVSEGDASGSLFVVVSGEVEIAVDGKTLTVLKAGDCVGELAYLSGKPHNATAVARTGVNAIRFDEPINAWASIPVQTQFQKSFQRTLIDRLINTTAELAKHLD